MATRKSKLGVHETTSADSNRRIGRLAAVALLIAIGAARTARAQGADTRVGVTTTVSDEREEFRATGLLSTQDTNGGGLDGPEYLVRDTIMPFFWEFWIKHIVQDWDIPGNGNPDGADRFQLAIRGRHNDGPHDEDPEDDDPNGLDAKESKPVPVHFARPRTVTAGGKDTHETDGPNHFDHYWVRSPILASPDPDNGNDGDTTDHLVAGAFEIIAWHNKSSRNSKPKWFAMGSSGEGGSYVSYDADTGLLSFNIGPIDILDQVGGASGTVDGAYATDRVLSGQISVSDLQFLGMEPDGRYRFRGGQLAVADPAEVFTFDGAFHEYLIDDTTGGDLLSSFAILNSLSTTDAVDEKDQPSQFLKNFVDRNIFGQDLPEEIRLQRQGIQFTFVTADDLAAATKGFAHTVHAMPATFLITAEEKGMTFLFTMEGKEVYHHRVVKMNGHTAVLDVKLDKRELKRRKRRARVVFGFVEPARR